MRAVFMGTPTLAADILAAVAQRFDVVGVYTRPDAVRGRGKKAVPSPVKETAWALGIPVYEPRSLRGEEEQRTLADLRPDVICVAAYGMILPREVLDIPPLGCLNVHGSLLPRWRGAAPIERAILAGDEEAGVCVMAMEEGLDTGAYCLTQKVTVGSMDAAALTEAIGKLGAQALCEALAILQEGGKLPWQPQDEGEVTYAEKIAKGELDADPALTVDENLRRVRASGDAHPSRCIIGDRTVTLKQASAWEGAEADPCAPGQALYAGKRLLLGCEDGAMAVESLTPAGKKPMEGAAFAAGMPALRAGGVLWGRL